MNYPFDFTHLWVMSLNEATSAGWSAHDLRIYIQTTRNKLYRLVVGYFVFDHLIGPPSVGLGREGTHVSNNHGQPRVTDNFHIRKARYCWYKRIVPNGTRSRDVRSLRTWHTWCLIHYGGRHGSSIKLEIGNSNCFLMISELWKRKLQWKLCKNSKQLKLMLLT